MKPSRMLLLLGWTAFLLQGATSMIFSVSPFYIRNILGVNNRDGFLIEAVTESLSNLSRFGVGYFYDRTKRRKEIYLFGVVCSFLTRPLFALSGTSYVPISPWMSVTIHKTIERFSNGILAVTRDTLTIESAASNQKDISLGFVNMMKCLGIAIGSLMVTALLSGIQDRAWGYRMVIGVSLLPSFIGLFLLSRFLPISPKTEITPSLNFTIRDLKKLGSSYWLILLGASILNFFRVQDQNIALWAETWGAPEFLRTSNICLFNTTAALIAVPFGYFLHKGYRYSLLIFSLISLTTANLLLSQNHLLPFLLGVILWGFQRGSFSILLSSWVANSVPPRFLGTALGLFYLAQGVSMIIMAYITGSLSDILGGSCQGNFLYGATGSGILLFIALLSWKKW